MLLELTLFLCVHPCIIISAQDVQSVYDGDTFRVRWDYPIESMPVRVRGIDTPEIRGGCVEEKRLAKLARDVLEDTIRNGDVMALSKIEPGKYFRLVADVGVIKVEGGSFVDISTLMVDTGLAREYDGGKRRGWCN